LVVVAGHLKIVTTHAALETGKLTVGSASRSALGGTATLRLPTASIARAHAVFDRIHLRFAALRSRSTIATFKLHVLEARQERLPIANALSIEVLLRPAEFPLTL